MLGLVINYVGKERALGIASEHDMMVLFLFLVSTYKVSNPNDVGDKGHNTSTSTTTTRGYFAIQISSQTTKKEVSESPLL